MSAPECFNCRYWKPDAHAGWIPRYQDEGFGLSDLLWASLDKAGRQVNRAVGWPGQCRRNPTGVGTRSIYWCGEWQCNTVLMPSLEDWILRRDARTEADKLRGQLKDEKRLSVKRFRELRALKKGKPNGHAREGATI